MAFFDQLKRRNVVKATISYLVISFAIIEASDILFPVLGIDPSFIRVLFIILLIGLPIWIVFAYVYEWTPTGFKATDKVDETKSIYKTTEKRLNRVIIGALALAVTFLLADKFYLGKEDSFPENGSIAIFPFTIQGTENIQYLREGMVDLISTKLDAIPGIQASDPNILLASFAKKQDNQALLRDPKAAAEFAKEVGANRLVLGNLTEVGNVLQIKISKYDLAGNPVGNTIVEEGELNTLYQKTDEIIRRLVAEELNEQGQEMDGSGVLTTTSFEAVIPYLKGVQLFRAASFEDAKFQFEKAIELDTAFTMAYYQLTKTMGQVDNLNWEFKYEVYPKLERLSTSLNGKTGEIIKAYLKYIKSDLSAIEDYERLYEKYGESWEVLHGLAESYFHLDYFSRAESTKKYFQRLVEIDPNNEAYKLHLADIAIIQNDVDGLKEAIKKIPQGSKFYYMYEFHSLVFQDSVAEETLEKFANYYYENPFAPQINAGWFVEEGVEKLEKILKSKVELWNRDSLVFQNSKKIVGGKHKDAISFLSNNPSALMQLGVSYFPPDLELANEEINQIIAGLNLFTKTFESDTLNTAWAYHKLLHGKFSLFLGDIEGYDKDLRYLERISAIEGTGEYANDSELADFRFCYQALKGIKHFFDGDLVAGRAAFELADKNGALGAGRYFMYIKWRHLHVFEAEAFLKAGNYEAALDIYEKLFKQTGFYDYFGGYQIGRFLYRVAQCHDALGNNEEAIAYYNQFAKAYEKSDPTYQGWVSNANDRLKVLVDSPERLKEPEEI